MNTIQRFLTKALASLMLAGLCFMFTASVSRAQCASCPTDIPPTGVGYAGWNPCTTCPVEVFLPNGCSVYVCYCWRKLDHFPLNNETTYQSVVTSIDSVGGCATDMTTQDILDAISGAVNDNMIGQLNPSEIPPCNGYYAYQKLELYLPVCMKLVQRTPRKAIIPCNNTSGAYCIMKCELCVSGSQIDRINCTFNTYGAPACSGGTAPTKLSDWTLNTCYLGPCGQRGY